MLNSLSHHAIAYTVAHLMQVAAPALSYDLEVEGGHAPSAAVVRTDQVCLRFIILPPEQWPALLDGTFPISQIPSFDGKISVPLFLEEGRPFVQWRDRELTIHADLLTLSFLLLSRGEELLISRRDEYGRFRYAWSLSQTYHLMDFPVVDEWGMLVRRELCKVYGEQALGVHTPTLTPTHDMDTARRFSSLYGAVRSILGGDLLRYRNPAMAGESARQYLASRKKPELDPELLSAEALMETSRRYGLRSEFYFKGLEPGTPDCTYDVSSPAVKAFAQKAAAAGMICGFHGSRETPGSLVRFQAEQRRVGQALGAVPTCGRQHYLCFEAGKTPVIWEQSGIRYDSTLGYPDREGFRCGTCHAYPLYDLERDRPLTVQEHPLIVMDATLRVYRKLSKEAALSSMKTLFNRCQAVGGDFVVLWHNGNVMRTWAEWYQQVYLSFIPWAVAQLRKEDPPHDQ